MRSALTCGENGARSSRRPPKKDFFFSFPKTTRVNELKIFDFGWWVGFFAPEDDGKAPVAFHSVVVHAPVVTL